MSQGYLSELPQGKMDGCEPKYQVMSHGQVGDVFIASSHQKSSTC